LLNTIEFIKYSACGNDFVLIESDFIPTKTTISAICARRTGIGADGIIFVCSSDLCDRKMRIFNADGGEAEMCGNGIRCVAHYLFEKGWDSPCSIESLQRIHSASKTNDLFTVDMGPPTDIQWDISINDQSLCYLNTGVPHAVIFSENIEAINLENLGPKIQQHSHFSPNSTNVNIATIADDAIRIRTYERGVGETLACGTGATASAIAASYKFGLKPPITVKLKSGDALTIDFTSNQDTIENVTMTGSCKPIYRGHFFYPSLNIH